MGLLDIVKSAAASLGKVAGEVAASGAGAFRDAVVQAARPVQAPAHGAAPGVPAVRHPRTEIVDHDDIDFIMKAASSEARRLADGGARPRDPQGYAYDPLDAIGRITQDGVTWSRTHPGTLGMPFVVLDRMARLPTPSIVINLAVHEMAELCHRQKNPQDAGLVVRLKDDEAEPTPRQLKTISQVEEILLRGGGKYQDGGLEGVVRRGFKHSLVHDVFAAELITERGGMPYGLFVLDGRTIRRKPPTSEQIARGAWGEAGYVQIIRDRIEREWNGDEFIYGIRRPRPDFEFFGYGFPELEEIAQVILNLTRAENYNAVTFTSGIHTSAILAMMTDMSPTQFESQKREIEQSMSVSSAKRRLPIVQLSGADKEDMKAVMLSMSNKDMEFQMWLHHNMKHVWAIYGMDPAMGNFWFGQEGVSSTMNAGDPTSRFTASRVRGLRPRARALARWLTECIVSKIDPDLMADFGGMDPDDEQAKMMMDVQQVTNWVTLDEMRARHDLDPYPDPEIGGMILNPVFFQAWSAGQQAMMGQQGGPPGQDPNDPNAESDGQLLDNLFQDPTTGGKPEQVMNSLYRRPVEAMRRGLIKPPAGLRKGGRWGLVPGSPGRAPVSVLVRA